MRRGKCNSLDLNGKVQETLAHRDNLLLVIIVLVSAVSLNFRVYWTE